MVSVVIGAGCVIRPKEFDNWCVVPNLWGGIIADPGKLVVLDKEERQEDRAFHLEAWNGYVGNITDRIGRGTIDTPQLCEVIFGGIQPSKLYVYLAQAKNNICNDGLLQRFQLLVYPDDPRGGVIDKYPNREAANAVFDVVEKLAAMDFIACGGEADEFMKTPYFHFTEEAQRFFTTWLVNHERRLRDKSEEPIMIEHLSKFRSLMPSLALIFHLIEVANGVEEWGVPIHCAQQAARWCKYLETHARRIYGLARSTAVQSARQLLRKIAAGALKDGFAGATRGSVCRRDDGHRLAPGIDACAVASGQGPSLV